MLHRTSTLWTYFTYNLGPIKTDVLFNIAEQFFSVCPETTEKFTSKTKRNIQTVRNSICINSLTRQCQILPALLTIYQIANPWPDHTFFSIKVCVRVKLYLLAVIAVLVAVQHQRIIADNFRPLNLGLLHLSLILGLGSRLQRSSNRGKCNRSERNCCTRFPPVTHKMLSNFAPQRDKNTHQTGDGARDHMLSLVIIIMLWWVHERRNDDGPSADNSRFTSRLMGCSRVTVAIIAR